MTFAKWSDIRGEHIERIGTAEFEAGKEQMLAEARGWRLAEIRRHRGLTQAQVATRMGVGKSRISQIEKGRVSTREVLDRYIEALGGRMSSPKSRPRLSTGPHGRYGPAWRAEVRACA
jgi:DNA-binding XRE family transcriptional regulator